MKRRKQTTKRLLKKGFIKWNRITHKFNLTPKGMEEMERRGLIDDKAKE